jgi:16S rRNA (cytidine1402-2'-O)-methyltransferase
VLQLVDAVACEDTRHTQACCAYGIERPGAQLLAVHQHNEAEAAQGLIERLQRGERIAYVSDAGTPAVSDPARAWCRRAGGRPAHPACPAPAA